MSNKYLFMLDVEKRDELIAGYKKRIASFMVDVRISLFKKYYRCLRNLLSTMMNTHMSKRDRSNRSLRKVALADHCQYLIRQ